MFKAICVFAALTAALVAREGAPLWATVTAEGAPRSGVPTEVRVLLEAGEEVRGARLAFAPSAGWKLEGASEWVVEMKSGETREFTTRATPLGDDPGLLEAEVSVQGWAPSTFAMKVRRAEKVPVPAPAKLPRAAAGETRASVVDLTIQGRLVFTNSAGQQEGLRHARVQLYDIDPTAVRSCGSAVSTDDQGNFTFAGSCGDLGAGDGPDLWIRVDLDSNQIDMTDFGCCTVPLVINDFSGGFRNIGTIGVLENDMAQAYTTLSEGADFMAAFAGESVPKVKVVNDTVTEYARGLDRIRLRSADLTNRAVVLHMYGHHVLHELAESPAPDFNNGICDSPSPSYCVWSPENAEVAWTEGFPDFFAGRVLSAFNRPLGSANFETHIETTVPGREADTPGFVAAILHDLADSATDDQHGDGIGRRDNSIFTFNMLWDVIKNYDPSSSLTHDHPTTIHEFWSGMRSKQHDRINEVSEVYREHHIVKPQPDLIVSSVSNPPATAARSTAFIVDWNVRNVGNEFAHLPGAIAYSLVSATQTHALSGNMIPSLPADLNAGASQSGSSVVGIPSTVTPGSYLLRACIGVTAVPESNENNNCTIAAAAITIQ